MSTLISQRLKHRGRVPVEVAPAARLLRVRAERRVLRRVKRKVEHSQILLAARLRDRRDAILHRKPVHMPNIVCTVRVFLLLSIKNAVEFHKSL